MNNRHLIKQGAMTVALAMILGFPVAQAEDVYLQAEQYQMAIPYGAGPGVLPSHTAVVVNASFEEPDCSLSGCVIDAVRGNYFSGSVSGWTVTGGAGVFRPNASIIVPTDGAQVGWSNGGELSQVLAEELAPNTTYTLSVDVGSRTDNDIDTYIIGLYANGILLAEDNNSLVPAQGSWLTSTVSYTSGATVAPGQQLEIRLDGNGTQEEFDNVRLDVTTNAANVTMWGYSSCSAGFTGCGAPSSPGPQINVPAGDPAGLTVHVRNTLPEATSIMIAGQRPPTVTVNGSPATELGRTGDGRLRSFAPEVPAAVAAPTTPIGVTNASFELPDCVSPGCFTSGTIDGWTVSGGGAGVFKAGSSAGTGIVPTDGDQVAYSNGGTISQVTGAALTAGTTYTLTVDVGDRANTGFPGYSVALYAGGVLLAEESALAPTTGWETSTVTYTATGTDPQLGQPIEIRLASVGPQTEFDSVVFSESAGTGSISTGTYAWSATDLISGSFLYQSASHVQLQVQMGMYGAMVQDAEGCGSASCAYPDVAYDAQEVVIVSEVDPALHDPAPAPANATVTGYRPQFFLINGAPFDGTLPAPLASAGDDVLIRLINASLDNHAMQLLGGHFEILGEDGRRAPASRMQYNALLPAAKGLDLLFTPTAPGTYTLFDRRLKLVNGPVDGGGMMHQIVIN